MVYSIMYFGIGFITAVLSVVVIAPLIHEHLVPLTPDSPQDTLRRKPRSWL
jgi:hypothetical protein